MVRKNDSACGNPKLIRTDVDCRAVRPKFNEGAWSPAKISDVTGGGLYLMPRRTSAGCYAAWGLTLDQRPSRTPAHVQQRIVSTN
ncbi:hypothetical protein [Bradyrhizobium sp. JR3.5]